MKNEMMMAGLLTLTAGVASQVAVPSYAQAASKLSEKKFGKTILLKIMSQARYTDWEGKIHLGHIYLYLNQEHYTPNFPNKMSAEMQGDFYFESDSDDTVDYQGKPGKTVTYLVGTDGSVLLDKVNTDEYRGNTYLMYGCSSTANCETGGLSLDFKGEKVTMNGSFSEYERVELLFESYNQDTKQTEMTWQKKFWNLEAVEVKE